MHPDGVRAVAEAAPREEKHELAHEQEGEEQRGHNHDAVAHAVEELHGLERHEGRRGIHDAAVAAAQHGERSSLDGARKRTGVVTRISSSRARLFSKMTEMTKNDERSAICSSHRW